MITKNPIPTLSLEELGVKDEQFDHRSELHGQGHVNRVIYNAIALAKTMGFQELIPECWAAAYLHDLARTHDGVCHRHGKDAVSRHLPKYKALFEKAGVGSFQSVIDAVQYHCTDVELCNPVAKVLKDADALDRCRLGDLDVSQLRLERSPLQVDRAEELFRQTNPNRTDWMSVWNLAVIIYNPHLGAANKTPYNWNDDELPRDRMLRRVHQTDRSSIMMARASAIKYAGCLVETIGEDLFKAGIEGLTGRPVIYMGDKAMENVLRTGEILSFWELHDRGIDSWHHRFTDNPEDARAYTEMRLFGEKCRWMSHGIWSCNFFPNADHVMARNYGIKRVVLRDSVMESASFTINDSQAAPLAFPWHGERHALAVLHGVSSMIAEQMGFDQSKAFKHCDWPKYIELQFHKKLGFDDILRTE